MGADRIRQRGRVRGLSRAAARGCGGGGEFCNGGADAADPARGKEFCGGGGRDLLRPGCVHWKGERAGGVKAMATQLEKGRAFRALHEREGAFVIPNPWDAGTARMLAMTGFEALATTSAGCAFALGKADGTVALLATMAQIATIAAATDLPVSGDLENG